MNRYFILFLLLLLPVNSFALIEVDITRGNLAPLPIAVSPLYIEAATKDIKDGDKVRIVNR